MMSSTCSRNWTQVPFETRLHFCSAHQWKSWRIIYLVCTCLVLSGFVDQLEVYDSGFHLVKEALERSALVAEIGQDTERVNFVQTSGLWPVLLIGCHNAPDEAVCIRQPKIPRFSYHSSDRIRGYRISLPRSSPSDSF